MTYQAPITGLHSPALLPFTLNSTNYLMLAQSWKFGVNTCSIGLTQSAACTRARVPLTFGHVHRPPPFTQFAQKGCQLTGLELRITTIYLKSRGISPEIKKLKLPAGGSRKHNFCLLPHTNFYIRNPEIESYRLIYMGPIRGGGWSRGVWSFLDPPSRIFLGHFLEILNMSSESSAQAPSISTLFVVNLKGQSRRVC